MQLYTNGHFHLYTDLSEGIFNIYILMHFVELFQNILKELFLSVSSKNDVVFNLIKIRRKNSKTLKKVDKQMLGQVLLKKKKGLCTFDI